jgi:hypothetical protein
LRWRYIVVSAALSQLAGWENFYVIIGSSAAALTGLQFVVMVLGAQSKAPVGDSSTTRAFGTPTVVHFCAVLLISAILSAPWPALLSAAFGLGACGVAGCAYTVSVVRHTRRQTLYVPVLEDWIFHCVLPLTAYAALLVAAVLLPRHPAPSLFAVGGAALLLLFVGIHNAWDAVTFIAFLQRRPEGGEDQ